MKSKSLVSLLIAASLMLPITVATVATAADVTTISVATWGSSPAETTALNDSIAAFEKANPNIKVNLITDSDHTAQMVARFASHTPPDVFYVDAGVAKDWAGQGVLLDLMPYISKSNFSLTPFNPSYLAPFQVGSALYGLPKDANPLVLEGNKTLMAKAGIKKLPKTIGQFDTDARKFLKAKIVPMCVDGDINRLAAYFYAFGGGVANGTKSLLSSKADTAALRWELRNFKDGVFRTPAQLSTGWAGESFGKEKCGYTMEGAWLDPYLKASFPAVYSTMIKGALPQKSSAGSLAFTVSWSIGKDSTNKDQAWTFIQYMTGVPGMTVWTGEGVALPSRNDVPTPAGYAINGAVAKLATTHTMPNFVGWSKVVDAFNNTIKKLIQNKHMNVTASVAALQKATNAAFPA